MAFLKGTRSYALAIKSRPLANLAKFYLLNVPKANSSITEIRKKAIKFGQVSTVIIRKNEVYDDAIVTMSQVNKKEAINFINFDGHLSLLVEEKLIDKYRNEFLANKWVRKYIKFETKWRNDDMVIPEFRVKPELEKFEQSMNFEWDWKKDFEMLFEEKTSVADESLYGSETVNQGIGIDFDKDEEKALEKWKKSHVEMVTLNEKERLEYARMVRGIEDEHEMQWGEVTSDWARWDDKWPRYLLPDGTPMPNLEDMNSVNLWKQKMKEYETRKNYETARNRVISDIINDKANDLSSLLMRSKIILSKLGTNNQKILKFNPKTISDHPFLAGLSARGHELMKNNTLAGSASRFFDDSMNFVKEAKKEVDLMKSNVGNNENTETYLEEEEFLINSIEDSLNEIHEEIKKKEINYEEGVEKDPRLNEEFDSESAYRLWKVVLKRQQKLFDSIPENQEAVKAKINENLRGTILERDNEKIILPNNIETGNKSVDAHFKKLVEAINAAGSLSYEDRLEFFRRIPSTIGGPGPALGVLSSERIPKKKRR